ncbi:MAG: M28 family metallopeptidase, partial [Planctomycetota bacterium]
MRRALVVLLVAPLLAAEEVSREKLEAHVRTLASPEYGGRRGEGARKAEEYVDRALREAGLKTRVQEFKTAEGEVCRNVIALLASGERPTREHVIVSAHYDHLGRWGGTLFPGAADNAAGVAAMLEIARLLKPPLQRDVLFISFDQEEVGLVGSTLYVSSPERPLEECAAFLTFDILGRDLADATKGTLFCLGLERSDTLFAAIGAVGPPEGLELAYVGADVIGTRSDYGPFRDKKVPFVFFSAGEFRDYHQPTDTPGRLNFDKLHKETQAILAATRAVIGAPRPKFLDEAACRVEEPASLERVVGQLLENKEKLALTETELVMAQMFRASLKTAAAGAYT